MAFFLGDPERGTGAHEERAEKISRQASKFVREHWRWQDMQAYVSQAESLVYDVRCTDEHQAVQVDA